MPVPPARSIPTPRIDKMLFLIILIPLPVTLIPDSELEIEFDEISVESAVDSILELIRAELIEESRIIFDLTADFTALIFIPIIDVPPPELPAPFALKIKSFLSDKRFFE